MLFFIYLYINLVEEGITYTLNRSDILYVAFVTVM